MPPAGVRLSAVQEAVDVAVDQADNADLHRRFRRTGKCSGDHRKQNYGDDQQITHVRFPQINPWHGKGSGSLATDPYSGKVAALANRNPRDILSVQLKPPLD